MGPERSLRRLGYRPPVADLLRIEHDGDVAVVHIERPPANAFSPELLDEGSELVDTLRADPPGAVVLTGLASSFPAAST